MVKIEDIIKLNTIDTDCQYYNWDKNKDYGAKCDFYDASFHRDENNIVISNCYHCDYKFYNKD